jgi:Ca2+-binding RTX toxin-like protein
MRAFSRFQVLSDLLFHSERLWSGRWFALSSRDEDHGGNGAAGPVPVGPSRAPPGEETPLGVTSYSLTPSSTSVSEGVGTITFTVTRSGDLPAETIFASTTTNQGSSNNGDYTGLLNQAITFSAGQTTRTFTVSITNDSNVESNETFGVIIQRNASDPVSTFLDSSTFTIQDNDTVATSYSLTPSSTSISEGVGTITFTVTRSGGLPAETIFASTTTNQGSSNNGDYTGLVNQAITFSTGQTTRTFTVSVNDDSAVESNETFGVIIQRNSGDPVGTFLDSSTFTIQDNDTAATTYSLTPSSTTVDESTGTITFTVTRSGGLPAETIFASTTTNQGSSNNGDYTGLLNQAITFSAGQTTRTFTVSITDDSSVESNETFGVIIQRNSGDPVGTFLDSSTFTIQDNDTATTSYSLTPSSTTVNEDVGTITFTVTRSGGLPAETIFASTTTNQGSANNGDYTGLLNQAITFGAGQTTQTFTVAVTNDTSAESNETFGVIIQRNSTDPVDTFLDSSTFTIQDNDAAATSYSLTPISTTVNEDAGTITFTVTRSGGLPAETIFASTTTNQGSANNGDYTGLLNQAITFGAGQTTQTFTVSVTNDTSAESNETFGVIIQRNATDPVDTFLDSSTFTIQDNDSAPATTYSITPGSISVDEDSGVVSFTVTRSGVLPAETVFVSTTQNHGAANSGDYTGLNNLSLSFNAGQTSRTVSVQLTDDGAAESNETFGLIVQRNASDPITSFLTSATFTIADDDTSAQTQYSITPGSLVVNEAAGSISFTVNRSGPLPAESVFVSTVQTHGFSNNGDYSPLLNQSLTFASGQTSQTVTVSIMNDSVVEQNEAFGLIVQRNSSDPPSTHLADAGFTIVNDDGSGWSISGPSSVSENAGGIVYTITRPAGLSAQTVYVSTTTDQGSANQGDYGGLLNRPVTFAAGATTATVTVNVTDDTYAEPSQTFGLIVQQSGDDPISNHLAATTFTITDDDATAPPSNLQPSTASIFAQYGSQGEIGFLATLALAAYHLSGEETTGDDINSAVLDQRSAQAFNGVDDVLHLLTTSDLPGLTVPPGSGDFQFSGIDNGVYVNQNAAALVGVSNDALFLSFRGTNDNEGWDLFRFFDSLGESGPPDVDHWRDAGGDDQGMADHWALFAPLISALNTYLAAHPEIEHIYVTGHSLGAAMATRYMSTTLGETRYSSIVFANPGFEGLDDFPDPRLVHLEIEDDLVPDASIALHYGEGDRRILIENNSSVQTSGGGSPDFHDPVLYQAVALLLATGGYDLSSSSIPLDFAQSTIWNVLYPSGSVSGTSTADSIRTGSGADTVFGLDGDDFLYSGDGDDSVFGGAGLDFFVGGAGAGNDSYDGGADTDTLSFESTSLGVIVNLSAGSNQASGPETGVDQITGVENVIGGAGADQLTGNAGANALSGLAGDDTLNGAGGADLMTGGAGDDTYVVDNAGDATTENAAEGTDTVHASTNWTLGAHAENLTLIGSAAIGTGNSLDNMIIGNAAANSLAGSDGADTLTGGAGVDAIEGGDGDDVIHFNFGDGVDSSINGGAGTDRIVCQGNAGGETLDAFWNGTTFTAFKGSSVAGVEQAIADMGGGVDWLRQHNSALGIAINLGAGIATGFISIANIENAWGSAFADTLTGSSVANIIRGGAGDDQIDGGGDNDTLVGDDGADTILGGDGADAIFGLSGADNINAGDGNDTINYSFGEGVDGIDGGAGTDTIVCQGNSGAETLEVAWDGSSFTFFKGGAVSSIEQAVVDMGVGGDWLRYTNSSVGISVDLTANTASGFVSIARIENAAGGTFNDTLTGSAGGNNLLGNAGDDIIDGAGGNDTINGGAGLDTITGGVGGDTMTGGADADTFVFAAGSGGDSIGDFDANTTGGQDFLDISGYGITSGDFGARVVITDQGVNTLVTIDGSNTIVLFGVTGDGNNVVTEADFILGV